MSIQLIEMSQKLSAKMASAVLFSVLDSEVLSARVGHKMVDYVELYFLKEEPLFSGIKTGLSSAGGLLFLFGTTTIDNLGKHIDALPSIDGAGGSLGSGDYLFSAYIDLLSSSNKGVFISISSVGISLSDNVDSRSGTVDSWAYLDHPPYVGTSAVLYVSTTDTDPTNASGWSPWSEFNQGGYIFRAIKFKLVLSSNDANYNIAVSKLQVSIRTMQ